MDPLVARVRRTIRRHDLLPASTRVLAAVSGGSDSTALLHLLVNVDGDNGFDVVGVAHVHHGLRGPAADRDAAFCRELAEALSLPFHLERVDVRQRALNEQRSLEDAARAERYEALARVAARVGAGRIAVGHTRDDQAETVLLKLLRGAGTGGLGGIYPRRGGVVRPLLEIGREELREWLRTRGLPFVEDETNADVRLRRNAIRHAVMPLLVQHFGAAVPAVLARHAEVAREDEAALKEVTASVSTLCVRASGAEVRVDRDVLRQAPPAIQRRVIRGVLLEAGVREPGLEHVLAVAAVARGAAAAVELPGGFRASRSSAELVVSPFSARAENGETPFCYELTIPGSLWIPEVGQTLDAVRENATGSEARQRLGKPDSSTAVVCGDRLPPALTVRSWKPGDALRPLGLGGRKKVQDLFVDRKVPAAARRRVPLVVDGDGCIVWVMGHAIDEAYRVTEATQAVVVLTMSESGGRG